MVVLQVAAQVAPSVGVWTLLPVGARAHFPDHENSVDIRSCPHLHALHKKRMECCGRILVFVAGIQYTPAFRDYAL